MRLHEPTLPASLAILGLDSMPPYSLGQLIKIIRESQMEFVVDKLIDFSAGKDEELRDIAGLGACSFE